MKLHRPALLSGIMLMAASFSGGMAYAEENSHLLCLKDKTDTTSYFLVDNSLAISLEEDKLKISHSDGESLFRLEDIAGFRYEKAVLADMKGLTQNHPIISLTPNEIRISGTFSQSTPATICTATGIVVDSFDLIDDVIIDLNGYNPGIYILYYNGGKTLKFFVKD